MENAVNFNFGFYSLGLGSKDKPQKSLLLVIFNFCSNCVVFLTENYQVCIKLFKFVRLSNGCKSIIYTVNFF